MGIIILSDLPMPESETILVNTLAKAWKQFFTQLIGLSYKEGLPVDCLKAIPRFNRSRDIP